MIAASGTSLARVRAQPQHSPASFARIQTDYVSLFPRDVGRAVAGDWTGIGPAIVDFSGRAWPAAIMVLLDVVVARVLLSREPDGNAAADRAFGVIYLLMGCVFVAALGKPT